MILEKVKQMLSGEGRTAVVKRNIFGSFLLKGISIIVTLLLVPITIGYVNAELYGVWLTVASIMTWIHFMDIGFTQGLKNKLTEALAHEDYIKGKSLVSTTYFMLTIIFIPLCIVLELVIPMVNWPQLLNVSECYSKDVTDVMRVVVAIACLQMIVNVIVSVIAAFQKVAFSNSFGVIGNILSLVIILFIRNSCSPSLIILALTIGLMPTLVTFVASFICYCSTFRKVAPDWKTINPSFIKDLLSLGYKFFIINIQVLVLYWSTNVLISYVSSPIEVTRYNIAYQLMNVSMMVFTIIMSPLWPAYTDAYTKGDYEWMKKTKKKMGQILLLSIICSLFLLALSQPIYNIWIGEKVEIPFVMTFLVFIFVCLYCWQNLNGTLIVAMSKMKLNVIILTIGMTIHFPFSLMFSKWIGCYGVLLSMIIISFMYAVVYHVQVNNLLNKTAYGIWNK